MIDHEMANLVENVHEHLQATKELPVERTSSRWIGEAEAVARDLVGADVEAAVLAERLGHVRDLLEEVDSTGHEGADDHVEAARRKIDEALDRIEQE